MFANRFLTPVRAAVLAMLLVAVGMPAAAQQPSAGALTAAKEILALKGAAALFSPIVPGVIEQTKNVLAQTNPMLTKDLNEVADKLREAYAARTAELLDKVALLYATRFSEAELKSLLAFYKTPLGKKVIDQEPQILDQSMRDAQAWANELSQEIFIKFREEMKKRGHDL
jgi:hypothetical protein